MERVMSVLLNYFAAKKTYEVHLVLYGRQRDIFYDIDENIIIHKPTFEFDNSKRIRATLKTLLFLRKTVKHIGPKSILSFGERWNNLVMLALMNTGIPIYLSDRAQPDKSLGAKDNFLRKILYPRAKGLIAQTLRAKEYYESISLNNNITVIGNPIPQQNILQYGRENIVLSVGRLIKSKHHDELIKIFSKIGNKDWKLIIVGGDALKQNRKQELETLIRTLNVKENVILAGSQKDVASYYKRSSIFAFTSSSEGFPNVVGEALSFGLPVISFDCVAGPADMINDGSNGYLIQLFNYEDFSQKLELLMNDLSLRKKMSQNGPLSIRKFEKENIGQQYYRLLTELR